MVLDKTLILKGIAAVGAVAGGGVSVAYGTGAFKSQEEKDKEAKEKKKNEVNEKLTTLGLGDCHLVDNEVTSPTAFSKECQLTKEQFEKINFSNKGGEEKVNVAGWSSNVTLNISNKDDVGIKFTFKNPPSDLTITGEGGETNKITLKKGSDKEFEEKDGKLRKIVDGTLKAKLDVYNSKFENLSLPETCRFDVTEPDTSLECEVSEEKLKQIKFSNKGNGNLTVDGWNGQANIKLKIETKSEGGHKYTFKDSSNKLTILGDRTKGKITIKSGGEQLFEDGNGESSDRTIVKVPSDASLSAKLKEFNKKLSDLNVPDGCRFDEGESDTSIECGITENDLKKIKFSNKGNGELKVNNWGSNGNLKLKVEKKNDQGEIKFTLKGSSSDLAITGEKGKGIITLKSGIEREFEIKDGALSKVPQTGVNSEKLKQHNQNLEKINLPQMCRFDEAENETKITCAVSKEDLKKIKFWNKQESQDLTIEDDASFTTANLEVKEDKSNNLKLVFKDVKKTVKVKGGDDYFNLRKNTSTGDEFEIRENALGQVRKVGKKEIAGLTCTYSGNGNSGTCKPKNNSVRVFVSKGNCKGEVTLNNCQNGCFKFSEYEDGYNLTTKFTYTGTTTNSGTNNLQLEKDADYDSVNKEESGGGNKDYLTKKTSK